MKRNTFAGTAYRIPSSLANTTGFDAEQTLFIPLGDDVELWDVSHCQQQPSVLDA